MSGLFWSVAGLFSLHANCTQGRLALARRNLAWGADVNARSSEGTTPLHAASYNGHLDVVRALVVEYGADVAAKTDDGWTALHCASMNGFLPCVRWMLEESPTPASSSAESNDGWTALHCAAAHGFLPVVRYLVEKQRMEVDLTTYNGWPALHWACCNGHREVVAFLLSRGARAGGKTGCGSTVIHVAAREGRVEVLKMILGPLLQAQAQASSSPASSASSVAAPSVAVVMPVHSEADDGGGVQVSASSSSSAAFVAAAAEDSATESSAADTSPPASAGLASAASSASRTPIPLAEALRPLSSAFVRLPNDAGLDSFTLAVLKGKHSAAEIISLAAGKESFTPRDLQRAHDLHEASSKRNGTFLNRDMLTWLRRWMQAIEYDDEESEESVQVMSMRDMLRPQSSASAAAASSPDTSAAAADSLAAARPASLTESAEDDEIESEDDSDDSEVDEPDSDPHESPQSSPPALDNAHLARSDPTAAAGDASTAIDWTAAAAQQSSSESADAQWTPLIAGAEHAHERAHSGS